MVENYIPIGRLNKDIRQESEPNPRTQGRTPIWTIKNTKIKIEKLCSTVRVIPTSRHRTNIE